MTLKKILISFSIIAFVLVILPVSAGLIIAYGEWSGQSDRRYRCTGSTGQSPMSLNQSVVQIFSARSARWRGVVAAHSWLAFRKKGTNEYVRYEVIGWNQQDSRSYIRRTIGNSDNYWYGYRPEKIFQITGALAESAIPKLEAEIEKYQFAKIYRAWPGPNSNTFIAQISRNIPEVSVDLPPIAIGKDYFEGFKLLEAPSNRGIQIGYEGFIGMIVSLEEGVEINIGGAVYGIDFNPLAFKIISIGRIGMQQTPSAGSDSDTCET